MTRKTLLIAATAVGLAALAAGYAAAQHDQPAMPADPTVAVHNAPQPMPPHDQPHIFGPQDAPPGAAEGHPPQAACCPMCGRETPAGQGDVVMPVGGGQMRLRLRDRGDRPLMPPGGDAEQMQVLGTAEMVIEVQDDPGAPGRVFVRRLQGRPDGPMPVPAPQAGMPMPQPPPMAPQMDKMAQVMGMVYQVRGITEDPVNAAILAIGGLNEEVRRPVEQVIADYESLLERTKSLPVRNAIRMTLKDLYKQQRNDQKVIEMLKQTVLENDKAAAEKK